MKAIEILWSSILRPHLGDLLQWLRGIIDRYPGCKVEGIWQSDFPPEKTDDYVNGRRIRNILTIRQHGILLSGEMKKHTTKPDGEIEEDLFPFTGRLNGRVFYGFVASGRESRRFGAAALVCKLAPSGDTLKGGQVYVDWISEKIDAIDDRTWKLNPMNR